MKNPIRLLTILLLLMLPCVAQAIPYLPTAPVSEQDRRKIHIIVEPAASTVLPDSIVAIPAPFSDLATQVSNGHCYIHSVRTVAGFERRWTRDNGSFECRNFASPNYDNWHRVTLEERT
jgi:hypothetical protein